MSDVEIIKYDDKYASQLHSLLLGFSTEVYGEGAADLDSFVQGHWAIYLAMKSEEVIGFSSFNINHYFGLRPPTVGNTFLYVMPEYRRGRATYLLTKQAGYVSIDTNLPLETYYAAEASRKIGQRLLKSEGHFNYDCYVYPVEEVKNGYSHYRK